MKKIFSTALLALLLALLLATQMVSAGSTGSTAEFDVSLIQQQLFQQQESESIRKLLRQYAMFIDDQRIDDFRQLFTEDAVFTAAGMEYRGIDKIIADMAAKDRLPGKHLPFPAIIEFVSNNKAYAWSDFLRVMSSDVEDPTAWAITATGRYYDQLVKAEDGRWRFTRRDVWIEGYSNLENLRQPPL